MPYVPPNQQRQSTEGKKCTILSFLAGLNTRPATMLPQALQSAGDGDTSPLSFTLKAFGISLSGPVFLNMITWQPYQRQ